MPEISSASFSETDASNNSASPNGAPENMAPAGVNDTIRAVMGAVKRFWGRIQGAYASTGSSNAYVITLTAALSAYVTGERYSFRANFANTGACTADFGPGAKSIKKMTTSGKADPASGDIQSGQPVTVEYDGTHLVMTTPIAAGSKFSDAAFAIQDDGDATKQFAFQVSGVTTGTTRTLTVQDKSGTLAVTADFQGKQTVWVPAAAMVPATTNGAASGTSESSSNKVMTSTLDFDASTEEYAQFAINMPKGWNESTVTAVFCWTAASGSGDVIWGLQGIALSEGDAIDTAFGTAQTVTDTLTTASDVHFTSETSAITIGGTPAAEDLVVFRVYRDADAGGDTLNADAKLIGVRLYYTTDAAVDS